jgi:SAM-dependent methyltransferase
MPVLDDTTVYARQPLEVRDGMPAFSVPDAFIRNYERISADHLASLEAKGTNPWIPERLWLEMEATTVDLVTKYSKPGDAILDVGVGLARILSRFPGLRRFGMDISWGYLKEARSKGVEVCFSRIEDMPYRPSTFDLLVCTDVLEHVLDLNLCCQKLIDVLKPGGVMIVRVPVHEDLSRYIDPSFPYEFVHLRAFTEPSLRLLFERILRCEVVELTPGGYWPLGDRLKITLPFGRLFSIGFRVFGRIPIVRSIFYKPIAERLYHPIDANVVVRKPLVAAETMREGDARPAHPIV